MKKTTVVIIVLLLICLAYNFGTTGYYDYIFGPTTVIEFEPNEIKNGQTITINIEPTEKGVDRLMTVHSKNHLRKDLTDAWGNDCARANDKRSTGIRCMIPWTFKYRVPTTIDPGTYYFRFFDYQEKEFIRSEYFTVVE